MIQKRGCGIKDNYVRLYIGDISSGFNEVYKSNKDRLPYIFQFGAYKFPAGISNDKLLYFQPVATLKDDMYLLTFYNNEN